MGTTGFGINVGPARAATASASIAARLPALPWHAIWSDQPAALCGVHVINVGRLWMDGPGPWCVECVALALAEPAWPGTAATAG